MLKNKVVKGVLGVSAVAALFAAVAVHAQSTGTQSGSQGAGQTTSGQTSEQSTSSQSAGQSTAGQTSSGSGSSSTANLSRADKKVLTDLGMANMAEIELARTAQSKSQNEQVKNFAQQMIDDHTRALNEVKQLAQTRGVTLPTELDRTHKAKADRMAALSGEAFDRSYMEQAGVAEHKKTHSKLSQAQTRAKDPELKALVARLLPVVDQHLNAAQQLHKSTAVGSSGTQGSTGSSSGRSSSGESKAQDEKMDDETSGKQKSDK
ncbi:DUF4142 domain-containing protein [Massilia sp. CF038]|uniref:DUF4142 domain-containing protein n=1 Tax=Massilia sp. CF038 TaxID=1881045 RepID=UPI00092333DF|nr:DUF4142 domain-containing protein [Massilia sp. CF038]SHH63446.1 putative membrane protein [Massilia sp. CF038]